VKIDLEAAQLLGQTLELMQSWEAYSQSTSRKWFKELWFFHVESRFYSKNRMKRDYARESGIATSELEYHHPFEFERIVEHLLTLSPDPAAIRDYIASLPSPQIVTKDEHRRAHA
jgi:hypothetical protein